MTETKTDRACGGNDMIRIAIVEDEDMYVQQFSDILSDSP